METRICKDCKEEKPLSDFGKNQKWYRHRCKKCHNKKFQPATGKPNTGRFKKGDIPPKPFKKGHQPWNKGKKGYRLNPDPKKTYRQRAFAIYENLCEGCHSKNKLQVHHIDSNNKNNKDENLMILCDKCHNRLHGLKKYPFDHFELVYILHAYYRWDRFDDTKNKFCEINEESLKW